MSHLGTAVFFLALGQTPAASAEAGACSRSPLQLPALIQCARDRSPALRAAELEVRALEGRRTTASVFFPSRPTLELRAAQRELLASPGVTAFNGGLTLSQEFEIAGQQGRRTAVVDAELTSARRRREVLGRQTDAVIVQGFYRLLAAQEDEALASVIASAGRTLARSARQRAERELTSELDATVAESEAAALVETALLAVRRREAASIALGLLVGAEDPRSVRADGSLAGLPAPPGTPEELVQSALRMRGEVLAARTDQSASQSQLELVERSRFPNLTVSGFADRDGFGERVLGGGLGLALPLPGLWPDRSGEITEAKARVGQADARSDGIALDVRGEVLNAVAELEFRDQAARAYPPDFHERAIRALRSLESAVGGGRLAIRDALLSQRSLAQGLQAEIEVRAQLAIARLELRRASGLSLVEGGTP